MLRFRQCYCVMAFIVVLYATNNSPALCDIPTGESDAPQVPLLMSQGMFQPGGGVFVLMSLEEVQKELGLSDQQKEKLSTLHSEVLRGLPTSLEGWQALSPEEAKVMSKKRKEGIEKARKELPEILSPQQFLRLKQIRLQVEGFAALYNTEVAQVIGITKEQKAKIENIRKENRKLVREKFKEFSSNGAGISFGDFMANRRKALEESILKVLTAEQLETFKKMQGEKIDLDFSPLQK